MKNLVDMPRLGQMCVSIGYTLMNSSLFLYNDSIVTVLFNQLDTYICVYTSPQFSTQYTTGHIAVCKHHSTALVYPVLHSTALVYPVWMEELRGSVAGSLLPPQPYSPSKLFPTVHQCAPVFSSI